MAHSPDFHRVLIDLDLTHGPVGVSVETWVDHQRVGLTVLELPGPFDTPADALAQALAFVDQWHGVQLRLPL